MTNFEELRQAIKRTEKSMVLIAKEAGIVRETLYNRLNGLGDFTSKEIVGLTKALNLSREERDKIFLS